ncbi:MAG TPA: hypothetical protein ENI39_05690 [Anaerolineae bacterium]|nr:hypothetical protein [Anaerolineae bacterium]
MEGGTLLPPATDAPPTLWITPTWTHALKGRRSHQRGKEEHAPGHLAGAQARLSLNPRALAVLPAASGW